MLKSQDEAEFVLETFQSVVAQLQEQRKELEQLSAEARERANSAEKFSERIVASLPSGLIAFDGAGLSMAINTPGRTLLEVDGTALGESYKQLFGAHEELAKMVGDCLQTRNVVPSHRDRSGQSEWKTATAWRDDRADRIAAGAWTKRRVVSVDGHHRSHGVARTGGAEEQSRKSRRDVGRTGP